MKSLKQEKLNILYKVIPAIIGFGLLLSLTTQAFAATAVVYPDAIDGTDTADGQLADVTGDESDPTCNPDSESAITADDGCYTADKSDIMRFSSFDTSAIPTGSTIDGVTLEIEWGAENGLSASNFVRYWNGSTLSNTTIQASDLTGWNTDSYDIYGNDSAAVDTLAEVTAMDIEFTNNDGGSASAMHFDYVRLSVDYTAPTTTISGTIYSDEGSTAITSSPTIKMVVGTSTPGVFTTTANGSGVYTFNDVDVDSLSQPIAVYL